MQRRTTCSLPAPTTHSRHIQHLVSHLVLQQQQNEANERVKGQSTSKSTLAALPSKSNQMEFEYFSIEIDFIKLAEEEKKQLVIFHIYINFDAR